MKIAFHLRILIGAICLSTVGIIFVLIRQNRLKEKYGVLWLFAAFSIFVFGLWPDLLTVVSKLFRLHHLTTLFMVAFLFLFGLVLKFTVAISQLYDRNLALAQEVAMLKESLKGLAVKMETGLDQKEEPVG